MSSDLWKRYCGFYDLPFSAQMRHNRRAMEEYFVKWKRTDLFKSLAPKGTAGFKDIPITTYSDYPMLSEFGKRIIEATEGKTRRRREGQKEYYDRINREEASLINGFMVEPLHFFMKSTGTTGRSKWITHGETFWNNLVKETAISSMVIACSDGWGDTKLEAGDGVLNLSAPIPYMSGYTLWGLCNAGFKCVPPLTTTDNLQSMQEKFFLTLKAIRREKVVVGGSIGPIFYMICKFLVDPKEFYQEYYYSMDFGLKKMLLYLKLLQIRLSRREKRTVTDIMPLKGAGVAGMNSKLYINFFEDEFGLHPLHVYGSTETGILMRGDPDRKSDLIPDLRPCYLEFKNEEGEIKDLDELKKGEVYDLIVTPFGSILFRYDIKDFFRVTDFRDDGMPVFAFEGREVEVIQLYSYYITPNIIVEALSRAGLKSSDKWAVAKLLKPKEHLRFLMEKNWPYTEKEAEKIIYNSLIEAEKNMPQRGRTLVNYINEFKIDDPSEVLKVEYLKRGAFLRYSKKKAEQGTPMGQYKPPKIIPPEKNEIYQTLKNL